MSVTALIELDEVGVRLGRTPILIDVTLGVDAGEVVGISGANGSGKTTLLRVMATLLRPNSGRGRVLDKDLTKPERFQIRSRIELIGHRPALYPHLTLAENLVFIAALDGVDRDLIPAALRRVGLAGAASRRADQASQGMHRRAEFARVWLTRPQLLLLDEAHAGLDDTAAGLVADAVAQVRSGGGAVVVVSHDAARSAPFVDRHLRLHAGSLQPA